MGRRIRRVPILALLFFLPTCSLNTFRPFVTVRGTLPGIQGHKIRPVGRGPTFPKCVAFSFSSPSTPDVLSTGNLQGLSPNCLLLNGIVSGSVTAEVATTSGIQISLPSGGYTITAVGIQTATDCSELSAIFAKSLPEIYRLGPSVNFNTSQGSFEMTSTYQSSATDIIDSCLPAGWVKNISAGGDSEADSDR